MTLRLDVNAAPGHDAQLRLGASLRGEWYAADGPRRAGGGRARRRAVAGRGRAWAVDAGRPHGAAGPGGAPAADARRLARRAGGAPRRAGRGVPPPAAAPRAGALLRRLGRVPEPAEPRLVLGVTWVAADEVRVAWTWRYRVGGDDRVYALSETRGMRGVRRPDAEQALLEALVLDDEQAYHLCRAHDRGLGLEDSRTLRDSHAILFAEELLPGAAGPGRGRGDRRPARLPRGRRRAGDPLRDPRGRRRRPRAHRLARPRGRGQRRRHPPRAGARPRGADQGHGPGDPAQRHPRRASTAPSSPGSPSWSRPRPSCATSRASRCPRRPPRPAPVGRARRGRHRRRAGRPVGAGRAGAARRSTRCRRSSRSASRPRCGPTSSTASAGWPSSGSAASAGSWPTTWAWARRCRRWRWSRTPATAAPRPFLVVAPTSVVSTWAQRGGAVHARA